MPPTGTANPWKPSYQRELDAEVLQALQMSDAACLAATRCTQWLLLKADAVDDDGALCHGWAVHAAFLAGVRWQEQQQQQEKS
jgi:hypothetical protein